MNTIIKEIEEVAKFKAAIYDEDNGEWITTRDLENFDVLIQVEEDGSIKGYFTSEDIGVTLSPYVDKDIREFLEDQGIEVKEDAYLQWDAQENTSILTIQQWD